MKLVKVMIWLVLRWLVFNTFITLSTRFLHVSALGSVHLVAGQNTGLRMVPAPKGDTL